MELLTVKFLIMVILDNQFRQWAQDQLQKLEVNQGYFILIEMLIW